MNCNNHFYNDLDNISDRSRRFSQCLPGSFDRLQGRYFDTGKRSWNEKAARNGKNERHATLKKVSNLILWGGCFFTTLSERSWNTQICCYLSTIAFFVSVDPFEMFDRIFAPQSKNILSFLLIMFIPAVLYPQQSIVAVISVIALVGLLVVRLMNKSWLATYNWMMSAEVQKALRIDPDGTAARAWQAHGRRETRTMLYELGYAADDETLDIFHRPVYICGYLNGYQKRLSYEQQLQKCQDTIDQLSGYKEKYENILIENQDRNMELSELSYRLEEETHKADHWKKQWEKERTLNEQIMAANNELLSNFQETRQIEQLKESSLEERVLSALDAGMSYAEAGKFAGCSKTTAWKIGKKRKEDNECGVNN